MKQHTFRDNLPKSPNVGFTPRKIGILGIPFIIAGLVMHCSQKVNDILQDNKDVIEEFSGHSSQTEKTDIAESWAEAREDQVLMAYRIKKGDTLSQIARKHGVTLESILKINPKITSADAIRIGQIIVISYDGHETLQPETFETTGDAVPLSFTKQSLISIMSDVLTRPKGKLLGAFPEQASDISRLLKIAEDTKLGNNAKDVDYGGRCAANMRAVSTSLQQYLRASGFDIDLGWSNVASGIGVGKHFADLSARHQLPEGYQVITTKANPDTAKLKELLLSKGKEYSIFILSYSHGANGHVNMAFRVDDDIIIFDPSWRGKSNGWPERFHGFSDFLNQSVLGEKIPGDHSVPLNRYDLYNITCVPAHHIDILGTLAKNALTESDDTDMRNLTMVFEGFTPRMKIDTQEKNKITYAIGYGTNVGTLQDTYPFASSGKDVAEYLKKKGYNTDAIKEILHGKRNISRSEARDLFEMRYVPRYQNMRTLCGKNWNIYPPTIRNMLVDMSYNMGEYSIFPNGKNPGFPDAVNALNRRDWVSFINAVVDSKYADDVGARRLGKWIALVVRDVLKGKNSGFSQDALNIQSTYIKKHRKDLNREMEKID